MSAAFIHLKNPSLHSVPGRIDGRNEIAVLLASQTAARTILPGWLSVNHA